MRRSAQLLCLLALAWVLAGAACNEDPANPPFKPPLRVIFTYPGALAQLEDNTPVNISIDFNRPVDTMSDMMLQLVPPPDSTASDPVLNRSKQNITWFGVATTQGSRVQRLLIYGRDMLAPEILVWLTADPPANAEFSGTLDTGSADRRVDFSAIFALSPAGGFDPLNPVTFESETPLAFAKPDSLDTLEPVGDYRIRRLEPGLEMWIVAIHDSNHDGRFSPLDDWWGYYHDPGGASLPGTVTAYALPVNPGDPGPPANIDITLVPPFDPLE